MHLMGSDAAISFHLSIVLLTSLPASEVVGAVVDGVVLLLQELVLLQGEGRETQNFNGWALGSWCVYCSLHSMYCFGSWAGKKGSRALPRP